jgi:hypothetical protein
VRRPTSAMATTSDRRATAWGPVGTIPPGTVPFANAPRPWWMIRAWFALALLCSVGPTATLAQTRAEDPPRPTCSHFQSLAPGLEYRHESRSAGPLSIHVLRFDLADHCWDLCTGLGQGRVYGVETVPEIAARVGLAVDKTPLAAINGDFFVIKPGPYRGDPRGIQIVDGELVSRSTGNSLWVSPDGKLSIANVASKFRAVWPDGKTAVPLGLNEARADAAAVLYTPTLGLRPGKPGKKHIGTRTEGGRELVLEASEASQDWLPLHVARVYSARVNAIRESGNTPLAPDRLILSLGPKLVQKVPPTHVGDILRLEFATEPDLRGVETALGVGRVLISRGKRPDLGPVDQPRHPRSLIGWNDRHLFLLVVDGRQPGLSMGMTYPEMASLADEYGCRNAVELDGGGSSTLWAVGRILNSPSEKPARPVANAIVIFPFSPSGPKALSSPRPGQRPGKPVPLRPQHLAKPRPTDYHGGLRSPIAQLVERAAVNR